MAKDRGEKPRSVTVTEEDGSDGTSVVINHFKSDPRVDALAAKIAALDARIASLAAAMAEARGEALSGFDALASRADDLASRLAELGVQAADAQAESRAGFDNLYDRTGEALALLERLARMAWRELQLEKETMANIADMRAHVEALEQAVAEEATVQDGAVALLGQLFEAVNSVKADLAAAVAANDPAEVQAQMDRLDALTAAMGERKAALAQAIVQNTPAADEPAPAPVEPQPEPVPVEPAPPAEEPPAQV